jgi:hypothetical protein
MKTKYKGIIAAQHQDFFGVFSRFLLEQNFTHILEIGTYSGGLTLFLKDASPKSKVLTFDVKEFPTHEILKTTGIQVEIRNIFDNDFLSVTDVTACNFLKEGGKKLILCDGGNKIKEFNCLCKYMNTGDFIMAHDYSVSREYFQSHIQGKVWTGCEITETDIEECSNSTHLIHYNQEEFQKIVWVCKTKI